MSDEETPQAAKNAMELSDLVKEAVDWLKAFMEDPESKPEHEVKEYVRSTIGILELANRMVSQLTASHLDYIEYHQTISRLLKEVRGEDSQD